MQMNIQVPTPLKSRLSGLMTVRDHTFLYRPLNSGSVVVDLGAHRGEFSSRIGSLFGCRCIGVEANPELAQGLMSHPSGRFFHFAITSARETVHFHLADNPLASTTDDLEKSPFHQVSTVAVPGITLEEFLKEQEIDHIDLLKVDIEGAELDLFKTTSDETLKQISQIALEFHDFCHFIREQDTLEITRRLVGIGFYPIRFMGNENSLFVNQGKLTLSWAHKLVIRYCFIPLKTTKRMLDQLRLKILSWYRRLGPNQG